MNWNKVEPNNPYPRERPLGCPPSAWSPSEEQAKRRAARAEQAETERRRNEENARTEREQREEEERQRREGTTPEFMRDLFAAALAAAKSADEAVTEAVARRDRFAKIEAAGIVLQPRYGYGADGRHGLKPAIALAGLQRAVERAEAHSIASRAELGRLKAKIEAMPLTELDQKYARFINAKKLAPEQRVVRFIDNDLEADVAFELVDGSRAVVWQHKE